MTETCDTRILAEEIEVLSNETMTLKDLGQIDTLSYWYADEIENHLGYDARDIRSGGFDTHAEIKFAIRFMTLLLYFRKNKERNNLESQLNGRTFDRLSS